MNIDLNTTNPLTFIEWKQYNEDIVNSKELSILYNNYLVEWKDNKTEKTTEKSNYVKNIYIQFLKNLSIETLEPNIRRFLNLVDYDNIYELELAVHYYVDIVKTQILNIRNLRDEVVFNVTKNKLKASRAGISAYLKNYISRILSIKEFLTKDTDTKISDIDIARIANSMVVSINNYASDEYIYEIYPINKKIANDLPGRVQDEMPNVIQVLTINKDGKKLKVKTNNISNPDSLLEINQPFSDYNRLPARYFRGEIKNLKNLIFTVEKNLVEKYLANDLYEISGNREKSDIKKIFTSTNPTNNLTQRYGPNLYKDIVNYKNVEIYPKQLSYSNTGTTNFVSLDLNYRIDLNLVKRASYIVPDPNKFEPGLKTIGYIKSNKTKQILRNIKLKEKTPLVFSAKTDKIKNNDQTDSLNTYNNTIVKNFGYQSKESSLNYSAAGINKQDDSISFWEDKIGHIEWKNTDTYPISTLNNFPETERLDDLLITNKTGIKLRSDIYGNEFYFVKNAYPKRLAGTAYIPSSVGTTDTVCLTTAEYYDGLFFDGLLGAISAAEYSEYETVWGAEYDSNTTQLTGIYDTFLVSDSTDCEGDGDAFAAPMDSDTCADVHTKGLSCGSISAVSAVDCGPFLNHPGDSTDLLKNYFTDALVPYFTIDNTQIYSDMVTTYESTVLNNPTSSPVYLYQHTHEDSGEIFVRNVYTQKIQTLNEAMSGLFGKHSPGVRYRIRTNDIKDFDIVGNSIYIQTSTETLTELYKFENGTFKVNASSKSIVS